MATILWVGPDRDEWWVTRDGIRTPEAIFESRDSAVDWACRVARRRSPCLVRVQDHLGEIVAQFLFEEAAAA